MHLDVSEFIEALRGKGGDPVDELGDVLFTVLAVAEHHNVDPIEAINLSREKHNV
jgi:NTP pyrophosphatase (non-canonical NTP hydrolase)